MPLGSTVFVGRVVDGGPTPLFSSTSNDTQQRLLSFLRIATQHSITPQYIFIVGVR